MLIFPHALVQLSIAALALALLPADLRYVLLGTLFLLTNPLKIPILCFDALQTLQISRYAMALPTNFVVLP